MAVRLVIKPTAVSVAIFRLDELLLKSCLWSSSNMSAVTLATPLYLLSVQSTLLQKTWGQMQKALFILPTKTVCIH